MSYEIRNLEIIKIINYLIRKNWQFRCDEIKIKMEETGGGGGDP